MKITFTCEKCGYDYGESVVVQDGLDLLIPHGTRLPYKRTCPNCAKLTYGPLTEEMVAEALHESYHANPIVGRGAGEVTSAYQREARFVLRLLNAMDVRTEPWLRTGFYDWLLDLARQT